MGRVTFEQMLDILPGAAQVVLSPPEQTHDVETAHHAAGLDDALAVVESLGAEEAYVIGGAGVYELFQPVIDRMVLSRVSGEYEGDAYFPEWDADKWTRVEEIEYDEFTLEEWLRG